MMKIIVSIVIVGVTTPPSATEGTTPSSTSTTLEGEKDLKVTTTTPGPPGGKLGQKTTTQSPGKICHFFCVQLYLLVYTKHSVGKIWPTKTNLQQSKPLSLIDK